MQNIPNSLLHESQKHNILFIPYCLYRTFILVFYCVNLSGLVSYQEFREMGPRVFNIALFLFCFSREKMSLVIHVVLVIIKTKARPVKTLE